MSEPTRSKYAILSQLCQMIPAHLVGKIARAHGVDKKARTFSPWSHVVTLLFAQLIHASSLHHVCDALRSHLPKLLTVRHATAPAKNTLSHANRNRDAAMAEELFWSVLAHLQESHPGFGGRTYKAMPRRFKKAIAVVDSTTISLVANCIDWARHRRRKAAAKLHLNLDLQSFLPRIAIVDGAGQHDKVRSHELCANLSKGEIVVFDKAYIDYEHLWELDKKGVFWVTRAKDNMAYRCVKRLPASSNPRILRDDIIVMKNEASKKKYGARLRLVRALVEVDGEEREMIFLTNNMEWAASSVCDLYKCRWSIEVFFKEIKQTLQLCDFLGHSKNAILWQVWTALLLYILVRALSFRTSWRCGFKRLFFLLRSCLWDTFDLTGLVKFHGTASGGLPMKTCTEQLYLPGLSPW
ncbi:MAG: IS4 family transposase [Candidatus Sumerlaeia bacterium]|nr:IS4 family transposase [Candidatus Sumerlaeia bacterium]